MTRGGCCRVDDPHLPAQTSGLRSTITNYTRPPQEVSRGETEPNWKTRAIFLSPCTQACRRRRPRRCRSRFPRRPPERRRGSRRSTCLPPALLAVAPVMWASQDATVLRMDAESGPIALGSLCLVATRCRARVRSSAPMAKEQRVLSSRRLGPNIPLWLPELNRLPSGSFRRPNRPFGRSLYPRRIGSRWFGVAPASR
jgi:hypothetical protein